MSATVRQVGIRLSLQGAQEVSRGLREIGDAGERNLDRVTREARLAAAALRALAPVLGSLAGFGFGSIVGFAQDQITRIASSMLGLNREIEGAGEAASVAQRAAETFMATMRDEGQQARNVIREVNDLLLTSAQRATNAANAQREAARASIEYHISQNTARQSDLPFQIAAAEARIAREQAEVDRYLAMERESGVVQRRGIAAAARLAEAQAERNNLLVQFRADQAALPELEEARRRAAGTFGVDELGPPAPPRATGGGGGARREEGQDYSARIRAAVEMAQAVDRYNQQINLQNAGLERAAPVLDAYAREMENLERWLDAGAINQDFFNERVRAASEALGEQMEQAQRAGQAVDQLSRQTSRFAASATGDFLKAAIAGKNLADTLSNVFSRLGSLLLDRGLERLFGGGKGSGFDLFGWLGNAVGGFFGGGGSSSGGASVAGARANGGPVEAGRPYLVGERGPEVFVPRQSGGVLPNGQGAATPVIHQHFDFRGATVDEVKFRRIAREESQRAVGGLVEGRRESRSVLA